MVRFVENDKLLRTKQQSPFFSLIQQTLQPRPDLTTREERQLKRTLIAELEEQHIENANIAHAFDDSPPSQPSLKKSLIQFRSTHRFHKPTNKTMIFTQ